MTCMTMVQGKQGTMSRVKMSWDKAPLQFWAVDERMMFMNKVRELLCAPATVTKRKVLVELLLSLLVHSHLRILGISTIVHLCTHPFEPTFNHHQHTPRWRNQPSFPATAKPRWHVRTEQLATDQQQPGCHIVPQLQWNRCLQKGIVLEH